MNEILKVTPSKRSCVVDGIKYNVYASIHGCLGCCFYSNLGASFCPHLTACHSSFRPSKDSVIFSKVKPLNLKVPVLTLTDDLLSLEEPFMLIKYHPKLSDMAKGSDPQSPYELITRANYSDFVNDTKGAKPIVIKNHVANKVIASKRCIVYENEFGIIYDFFHFKDTVVREHKRINKLIELLKNG